MHRVPFNATTKLHLATILVPVSKTVNKVRQFSDIQYGSKTSGLVIFETCRKFLASPKVFPEPEKRRYLTPKVFRPPKVFNS